MARPTLKSSTRPALEVGELNVPRTFGMAVEMNPNLVIPTRLKAEEAYRQFERLDQEWWLEASERAQFRMNIVPEFI
jgi:hypothetical protein